MPAPGFLDTIDLDRRLPRDEYRDLKADLEVRLGKLQRRAIKAGLPVVVLFEGGEGAGKGTLINRFIRRLDPRHCRVHSINKVYEDELFHPYLWRFWRRLPAAGKMTVLDRSWYGPILQQRVGNDILENEWKTACTEMEQLERQLCDGGYLIIKIFLHISKEEQESRYRELEANPATAWRITREDWIHHENYDTFCAYADEMLARSDSKRAPWHLISAEDLRSATVEVFRTIVDAVEGALEERKKPRREKIEVQIPTKGDPLKKVDPNQEVSREEYRRRLEPLQEEIHELQHQMYTRRLPAVIVYEGWDAAGKGGNIKRLTQSLDPRGYQVIPVAAPTELEKKHHYLWRFWRDIPKAGHVGIFDRSWYGRVLVERVEGFCTEADWHRAYREINEFEAQLTHFGFVVIKFWLHIDNQEQLRRFERRQADPNKQWKITEEDWRNRDRWEDYRGALRDMLVMTSTDIAPWTVVESNSKLFARLKALETVIAALKERL